MLQAALLDRRNIFANVPDGDPSPTDSVVHHCTPFTLPSNGVLAIDATQTITLAADATFVPECTATLQAGAVALGGPSGPDDMRPSFNASATPQIYATGAATVIAWFLFIMLIITPRTFFVGGSGGTSGLLGRRGMISGASGSASVIGVGSRPWLQKVAALTVAVSLTIATADTFHVAEEQYNRGITDADTLRRLVVQGNEIKISRVISDIFLWLAQVQTLIRLFSRHKEKVIIKWTGFSLIVLDMTFSILNNFLVRHDGRPGHFVDAISALNYLFQCALSMLYAAWVLYYSLTKHRYAFYHRLMPNIAVLALISIIAILTPLVFFIIDISNYNIAGWGDYFRWVGAAAASVVVWEWVERIEALEREEKKDGILGREIFDGDEMLENTPHQEVNWPSRRHHHGSGSGGGAFASGHLGQGISNRFGRRSQNLERTIMLPLGRVHSRSTDARGGITTPSPAATPGYSAPHPVASPVSRADTTSATSTVYTVRYHGLNEPMTPLPRQASVPPQVTPRPPPRADQDDYFEKDVISAPRKDTEKIDPESQANPSNGRWKWPLITSPFNPFKRRKAELPTEVLGGRVLETVESEKTESLSTKPQQPPQFARWDLKGRFGAFAAEQSERVRDRASGKPADMVLPVTIIPAQPRGRTWSPNYLASQEQGSEEKTEDPRAAPVSNTNELEPNIQRPRHQPSITFADQSPASRSPFTPSPQPPPIPEQEYVQIGVHDPNLSNQPRSPVSPISPAAVNPFLSPTGPTIEAISVTVPSSSNSSQSVNRTGENDRNV